MKVKEMSETKQLRRQNGMIAGVCGGLGEFFGISPNWFRLAILLTMLSGGVPGILIYPLLWRTLPKA